MMKTSKKQPAAYLNRKRATERLTPARFCGACMVFVRLLLTVLITIFGTGKDPIARYRQIGRSLPKTRPIETRNS